MWTALRYLRGHRFSVTVQCAGKPPLRFRAKSVLLANMGRIGPGVSAFPDASADDGLMRVGIVKADTPLEFAHLFWNALQGRPDSDPEFDVYEGKKVTVTLKHPQPLEYDGDSAGRTRHLYAEVVPAAVTVMVPRPA